ncbi:phage resistance protein [Candidatus Protofrankia californiensis]|uniref:phage resistance protein n=1 Tax=Candidatus Protofrankia californiensis TaxID=1839754 RepID=UPI0010418AD2|nr:phage resistance protein [Candidatus Protofrankia californiensis]
MTRPPSTSQPLLRDVIDIPERTSDSDFVLKLTEGVTDAEATLREYVLTDRLVGNFDETLGLIAQAVATGQSKAVYLHGSFGSGKSHFMAVLHALLRGEPVALARQELAAVLARHDGPLGGKKFLLVPYHLLGAKSIEQRVLGGYADYIRTLHPDAPVPAVHRTDTLLANAVHLRERIGDDEFIAGLPDGVTGGHGQDGADDEWGEGAGWTAEKLDAAFAAWHRPLDPTGEQPADEAGDLRRQLVSDLLTSWFDGMFTDATEDADGFVSLDRGLSEIARHAKGLGYDCVVLFLDELILWLANNMGNQAFVSREVQKITNFVEGGQAGRVIPLVSFIARQRDLQELVGENVAGSVQLGFQDTLNLASGRFDTVTLEDRNLPLIANRRLLRPRDAEAKAAIDRAFESTTKVRAEVWDTLLGGDSATGSDRDAFRLGYPFSPAFMDTLVYVSSALQRNRTALKLMRQLLVDHRDDLRLGQVVPVGDLWDVINRGADKPFTDGLKVQFEAARKLYGERLRPYLLEQNDLGEDDLLAARRGRADTTLATRVRAFTGDDRLVKTLLLAALAPSVPALRNLTARRLSALNHGSITDPIRGNEVSRVSRKVETWAGQFGEIKFVPGDDAGVGLELVGVEVDRILANAAPLDTPGARKVLIRRLLTEELDLRTGEQARIDEAGHRLELVWRGSKRSAEVVFGGLRPGGDLRDDQFASGDDTAWRLIVDYPFDDEAYRPADARARVETLTGSGEPRRTVCWVPTHLTAARIGDLRLLVILDALLNGNGQRFDSHAQHLGADDRQRARGILKSRHDALLTRFRGLLRQAYGLAEKQSADVLAEYGDHLLSLWPGAHPALPFGASLRDAARRVVADLLAEQFPGHPDLDPDRLGVAVRPAELKAVFDYVRQAAEAPGGRVEVARADRSTMRRIVHALGLGEMHEAAFVLGRGWVGHFHQKAAQSGRDDGADLSVKDLVRWIDEPDPRGLDRPVAGLVLACFAEQTDRAWYRYGGALNPPPDITAITSDMELRGQTLPGEADWAAARGRAAVVFGVNVPELLRGRLVRAFVADVQAAARDRLRAGDDLLQQLEQHARRLGLDPAAPPGRLRTARLAVTLLTALDDPKAGADVVRRLAVADLGGPPEQLARGIGRARQVADALARAPWETFDIVEGLPEPFDAEAAEILGRLRAAAALDEHAARLPDAIGEAQARATELLRRATRRTPPPPPERPWPGDGTLRPPVRTPPAGKATSGTATPERPALPQPSGVDAGSNGQPGPVGVNGSTHRAPGVTGGTEVIGVDGHGGDAGAASAAERRWRVPSGELDTALAALRDAVGGQTGEIEIIWRPGR